MLQLRRTNIVTLTVRLTANTSNKLPTIIRRLLKRPVYTKKVDFKTADPTTIDYDSLAALLAAATPSQNSTAIVNAPFHDKVSMAYLFLGFIGLYIVDEDKQQLQLVAVSGTEEYERAVEGYDFNPADYQLCLKDNQQNTLVKAVESGLPQDNTDWASLRRKDKSPAIVRLNQANSGIAYSAIYPFHASQRGALMYSYYQYPDKIDISQRTFMQKYTTLAAAHLR
jgi:hypothetical protein